MAQSLSIRDAWNAVALEERLTLIAKAKAEGIVAGVMFAMLIGSVAYGFDQILLLIAAAVGCFLVIPLFASYSWRRNKPTAILAYLAVRSVARRYAFGYKIHDFGVVLIFRGRMEELFDSEADEQLAKQKDTVDFDTKVERVRDVWICLLRGAVVVLSERTGGAKLEFIAPINADLVTRKPNSREDLPVRAVVLETPANGAFRERRVAVTSDYPGALYVFERQLQRLTEEFRVNRERQEKANENMARMTR